MIKITFLLNNRLTAKAKEHHIFSGSYPFTENDAIKMSAKRGDHYHSNTVFAQPNEMIECETDDISYGTLTISINKVQAYQCTKIKPGRWSAKNVGMVPAIFALGGSHFPGEHYLYKNVVNVNKCF